MSETNRLTGETDWIDLEFMKRERTPESIIEVGIQLHLARLSFRIPNSILRNWVSNAVEPLSTTG